MVHMPVWLFFLAAFVAFFGDEGVWAGLILALAWFVYN